MRGVAHRDGFCASCWEQASATAETRQTVKPFACRTNDDAAAWRRTPRGTARTRTRALTRSASAARASTISRTSRSIFRATRSSSSPGLSGSGKSTLAFDILFAEGQRRFLDTMSPYARQFVEQLEKPDVDLIAGLPPSVAIEQRVTRGGGKSTVATVTEVYHFLRLLFAKARHAILPEVRCAGGKADASGGDRKTAESHREGRRDHRARAAGEGAQRLPHRGRALGGAARLRGPARGWQVHAGGRTSKSSSASRSTRIDVVVGERASAERACRS